MLGAIIGDVVGSRFEFDNIKRKDFPLFDEHCDFTDDSVMTLAIAAALLNSKKDYSDLKEKAVEYMQKFGRETYPWGRGYGGMFKEWLHSDDPQPYNSWGNGAAMRVSPCGFFGKDIEEVKIISKCMTEVTHNHPEGIKGAEATSVVVFMAKNGSKIPEIKKYICDNYYNIDFTIDKIRPFYGFAESCQETVPQALEAFFESTDFEDAIRNAVSIGGDSDTIAAITGGVAEAYYGIPEKIKKAVLPYLDDNFTRILGMAYDKLGIEMNIS